ncbi:hypothetical protein [Candidatus Viridilinea mediisalina]|uniref:Macroglobulin domain-containing protein n=1 Tax=Candidatus Viridilinea mediisalina TaxID=2024553 RepID=A0A2A6RH79_9CHLR|nr:hypothetical protein [Candidatus Viridilinea mediisalina]PDW02239.1 hypothetical protein CJ255_15060 [Candidatus Viridilinea mediisalina]
MRFVFAVGFALTLGLTLALFSYQSFASAGQITVHTPHGSALCERVGAQAPAIFQGHTLMANFDFFRVRAPQLGGPEAIEVDLTFPDGRIFTIPASQRLDGVIDLPANFPPGSRFVSNGAGQLTLTIPVPGTWPYGCYTISARGMSDRAHRAQSSFMVIPGGQPGPRGTATLRTTLNAQETSVIVQGQVLEVDGRGFIGGEDVSLWLTAPDGTVVNFPFGQRVVQATPGGAFATSFEFSGKNPIGQYTVTALGQHSQFRVFASFEVRSRPVEQRGPAQLDVIVPMNEAGPQRTVFYINGNLFFPGERVDLWLTLPDGAVRGFPSTFADEIAGQFMVEVALDERLPTGFYQLTAQGANSRQLIIANFTLQQTSGTVTSPDFVMPLIGIDNDPTTPPDQRFVDPNPDDWREYGQPAPADHWPWPETRP